MSPSLENRFHIPFQSDYVLHQFALENKFPEPRGLEMITNGTARLHFPHGILDLVRHAGPDLKHIPVEERSSIEHSYSYDVSGFVEGNRIHVSAKVTKQKGSTEWQIWRMDKSPYWFLVPSVKP